MGEERMRLAVRQVSGLGNQLFQYAAALYYGGRYNAEVEMLIDPPERASSHGYARPFLLPYFSPSIPLRPYRGVDRLMVNERPVLQSFFRPLRRMLGVQMLSEPEEARYAFLPELPIAPDTRRLYLSGYWQAWQLVASVAPRLRRDLRFRDAPEGRTLELLRQIENEPAAISLHMRRGDYTLPVYNGWALGMDYYTKALELMRAEVPAARFFVFSDDIEFARAALPGGLHCTFIDHTGPFTAHEDLRLMSACRHHIIANSSFSWWGAWLNPAADPLVIAPRLWLNRPGTYFPGLVPPQWHLVG